MQTESYGPRREIRCLAVAFFTCYHLIRSSKRVCACVPMTRLLQTTLRHATYRIAGACRYFNPMADTHTHTGFLFLPCSHLRLPQADLIHALAADFIKTPAARMQKKSGQCFGEFTHAQQLLEFCFQGEKKKFPIVL